MLFGAARYVQLSTAPSSGGANWPVADTVAWFNTTRNPPGLNPLIVHTVAGTPSTSTFTLKAPGLWTISTGVALTGQVISQKLKSGSTVIAKSGNAQVSSVISYSGEFDLNAAITVIWHPLVAAPLDVDGDCNYISFLYHGTA